MIVDANFEDTKPVINNFVGEYEFLRNDFPAIIDFQGRAYPTVEHAFQAAKTSDNNIREEIQVANSARKAKQLGRKITLSASWETDKLDIMEILVREKFSSITELKQKLVDTGNAEIILTAGEGYWGIDSDGGGANNLGKILMKIRKEFFIKGFAPQQQKKQLRLTDVVKSIDCNLNYDALPGNEYEKITAAIDTLYQSIEQVDEILEFIRSSDENTDLTESMTKITEYCGRIDSVLESFNS